MTRGSGKSYTLGMYEQWLIENTKPMLVQIHSVNVNIRHRVKPIVVNVTNHNSIHERFNPELCFTRGIRNINIGEHGFTIIMEK